MTEPSNPPIEILDNYSEYLAMRHPLDVLSSKDPWKVGCGLVLAAHCTDAAVNRVTPAFFTAYPTWHEALGKTKEDLVPHLPGISHAGNKSEYILNWAAYLESQGGDIEGSIAALTKIKGFGRKTAGIVLYVVKGVDEAIPLDTHALRILDRLGWFPQTKNPEVREKQLLAHIPQGKRFNTFSILTQHGRRVCGARLAKCGDCRLKNACAFFKEVQSRVQSEALASPQI